MNFEVPRFIKYLTVANNCEAQQLHRVWQEISKMPILGALHPLLSMHSFMVPLKGNVALARNFSSSKMTTP